MSETLRMPPGRDDVASRVAVLMEALPYIRAFSGATIVIKYGGAAMTTPELKASFGRDVALLKLVGMNPVIVHGGGPDISRYSDRLGLEVRFVQGLRVTDAPTMELVKMVLVGKINKEIVAQLQVAGVAAVGLAGDDGGLIRASKAEVEDADLGFVGQVEHIDARVLAQLGDFVPVVASVGVDGTGQSYNINADTVAGALAAALRARKVIFLTDVEGLRDDPADPASLISECDLAEIERLMGSGAASSGMIPKLQAAEVALSGGVEAAHIVDGRVPHSVLMELFTEAGIGTKITA
jgi:acetylglutamate kinase